jgi:hypothetical protein
VTKNSRSSNSLTNGTARSSTAWGSRRRGGWVAAGGAAAVLVGAVGCSTDPSFSVGDCVQIEQRIVDADLEAADCADAVGTFDGTSRVYRVEEVLDGTDGGCPTLQGFFPVEFVHEPDGVTYCLVQQS